MFRKMLFAWMAMGLALAASPAGAASLPSLTGSWQLTFIPANSPTPLASIPGLATFTKDGSVIETDGTELVPGPDLTIPTAGSPGHGIWQPAPAVGTLYVQYISIVVNPNGSLFGKNVTTLTGVTLVKATTGTSFSGTYTTQFVSPSGVVGKTTTGKVEGALIPHPALP
jgi:hypothetical protein